MSTRDKLNKKKVEKLPDDLPASLVCLSCLAELSTLGVINNDDRCKLCDNHIDPYNLQEVEV